MRSKEDVISIIRSYCLANDGDEATTDLLLAVGAEILGVSSEEMQKMIDWTAKHGKPLVQCTALYCRNRCKDRLADYEDAEDALKKSGGHK